MDFPLPDLESFEDYDENSEKEVEKMSTEGIHYITINELEKRANRGIQVRIFDCRFKYEYDNGHIAGAINISRVGQLEAVYNEFIEYWLNGNKNMQSNNIIAFHCEFSKTRGVSFAKIFRNIDRMNNINRYPFINFPNVYIIKGGFERIYNTRSDLCEGIYLPMRTDQYIYSGEMRRMNNFFEAEVSNYYSKNGIGNKSWPYPSSLPIIRPYFNLAF